MATFSLKKLLFGTAPTVYAPLFGPTAAGGVVQSGTVGTAGQVLTSNGAGALPTFQTPASTGIAITKETVTGDGSSATVEFSKDLTSVKYILYFAEWVMGSSSAKRLGMQFKVSGSYVTSGYQVQTLYTQGSTSGGSNSSALAALIFPYGTNNVKQYSQGAIMLSATEVALMGLSAEVTANDLNTAQMGALSVGGVTTKMRITLTDSTAIASTTSVTAYFYE